MAARLLPDTLGGVGLMPEEITTFVLFDDPPEQAAALPSKETLGEILSALFKQQPQSEPDEWQVIEAVIDLISEHYGFNRDLVWGAVFDLHSELEAETGQALFGRALERPPGFATLGLRVAQKLLGEEADEMPLLFMSYH